MTSFPGRLAALVAASGTVYRQISEALSKALPVGNAYGTKRWPYDIAAGLLTRSAVFSVAGHFAYNERNLKPAGSVAALVANDEIVLLEFPTDARLVSIMFQRSVAAAGDNPGATPYADVTTYFPANANPGAFPAFDLILRDPNDPSFPAAGYTIGSTGTATEGIIRVPTWLLFAFNNRKRPMLISAKVAGAVPANSAVVVQANFVGPHI